MLSTNYGALVPEEETPGRWQDDGLGDTSDGAPGKVVRTLSLEEQAGIKVWAEKYVALSRAYRERQGR